MARDPEELASIRERAARIKKANEEGRAKWIQENPKAYAAEQAALEANRKRILDSRR